MSADDERSSSSSGGGGALPTSTSGTGTMTACRTGSSTCSMPNADDLSWMLGLTQPGWWAQTAMRRTPSDARPRYDWGFGSTGAGAADLDDSPRRSRVEGFAAQLRRRGYAALQLHPPAMAMAAPTPRTGAATTSAAAAGGSGAVEAGPGRDDGDATAAAAAAAAAGIILCEDRSCDSKTRAEFTRFTSAADRGSADHPIYCHVCRVKGSATAAPTGSRSAESDSRGPATIFWGCRACLDRGDAFRVLCDACYQDKLKFQPTSSSEFADTLPRALRGIRRMFDLEPGTKFALRSPDRPDVDGYTHIEGDKEMFHWCGTSPGLISQDRFGHESDVGNLRSRLLNLGADVIATIVQCEEDGLNLPAPRFVTRPLAGVHRSPSGWAYPGEEEDGEHTEQGFLSQYEVANCDRWLYEGLTCMETSLLSAFRYVPKAGPLHCEAHKDKGLLTIVLNPHGLEALVGGRWVPMDVDEVGQPLGSHCAVVFPGLTLEKATAGVFRATEHRVRNVGGGEARMSIVAKIRCHPDARLDVPWAMRKVHAHGPEQIPTALEVFAVSDLLAQVEAGRFGSSRSVNNTRKRERSLENGINYIAAVPPAKKPTHKEIFGSTTDHNTSIGLASLPLEVLTQILSAAGIVSLGRLACVSTWLRQLATHEYLWVSAANAANMDWVTTIAALPPENAVRWNVVLGPRLSTWERNTTISLWLTTDEDYVFTQGASLGDELPTPISQHDGSTQIQVDQRTPLSSVVAEFIQKHFVENEFSMTDGTDVVVHQGRPGYLEGGYYNSALKRINLNLTAWHHQLSDGDILAFDLDGMLAD